MSEAGFTDAVTHATTDPQPESGVTARPVTVITGACGGIGADLAQVFAKHGHDLALIARSRAKFEALADEIAASGRRRPSVLACDLTEPGAVAKRAASLEAEGARPHILVNNAGFGLAGQIASLEVSEQLALIDLNIRALLEITLRFLPQIREGHGKILNVASIAGYFPGAVPAWPPIMPRNPSFSRLAERFAGNCARMTSRSPRCILATPRRVFRPGRGLAPPWTSRVSQVQPPRRSRKPVMPG